MSKTISEVTKPSPTFAEILKKVNARNEEAAVDIYGRFLIGALGLVCTAAVIIFADPTDKLLGLVFLIAPVLPVFFGISDDFFEAKHAITEDRKEARK